MIELLAFVALGLASGLVAATMGVGGGIIFVPALVVFFDFAQHDAQGTSLAVIVPTALVGTIVHSRRGRVDWNVAAIIAVAAVAGALAGSWLALSIDPTLLRRLFAALVVVVAARLFSS